MSGMENFWKKTKEVAKEAADFVSENKRNLTKAVVLTGAMTFGAKEMKAGTMDKFNSPVETQLKQMQNAKLDLDTARMEFQGEQDRLQKLLSFDEVASKKLQSLEKFGSAITHNVRSFVREKLAQGVDLETIKSLALDYIKKENHNTKDYYVTYQEISEKTIKGGLPSEYPEAGVAPEHLKHQAKFDNSLDNLILAEVETAAETNEYDTAVAIHNESQKGVGDTEVATQDPTSGLQK